MLCSSDNLQKAASYFQFICNVNNNNIRRILNKAVQSFPAPFISISTPANTQREVNVQFVTSIFKGPTETLGRGYQL